MPFAKCCPVQISAYSVFPQCILVSFFYQQRNVIMMTSSNGNTFRITGHLFGEFTGPGEFPTQKPVAQSCDIFFDLRLNKRLSKQSWGWWFETQSHPSWRQCNVETIMATSCRFPFVIGTWWQVYHMRGLQTRTNEQIGFIWQGFPMKYALCLVMLCFVYQVVSPGDLFSHIIQGCFTYIGVIIWRPLRQWRNPEEYR